MATAAAAIVGKARRDVISYFLQRKAVSAETAVPWIAGRSLHQRILNRFVQRGIIIEQAQDTYYVDVAAYDSWRRGMRHRALVLLIGVVLIGAILAALTSR